MTVAPLSPHLSGLRWSAASAAFQIEGARHEGGRGRSIWDDFVESEGAVRDGSVAEPGPDSYHRSEEDVSLAQGLGLDRYRFSISWTRVQPDGTGAANAAGLDYYSRRVDRRRAAGVTPLPTPYHWDLPVTLEAAGGWLQRDTAQRFADYAQLVADRLGDRVRHWYTINEPAMTTLEGYAIGTLAPGKQLLFDALPTAHHQLLAHGLAMPILRAAGAAAVGLTNNHTLVRPLTDSPADQQAAGIYDLVHNPLFSMPLLAGAYPDIEALGLPPLPVQPGDLELISTPTNFYGVNFYNPTTVTAAPEGSPIPFERVPTPGAPVTGFGEEWPIVPEALTELLVGMKQQFGEALPPIIISENGAAFPDDLLDGEVDDPDRIDYLDGHIRAVGDAIEAGVPVEEYTAWSLTDNFEWSEGFGQRFGLVYVDYETGERTAKSSYRWYRALIAEART